MKQGGWLSSAPPNIGVEIAPRRVVAVAVARAAGGAVVQGHAYEPLPAGAVVPALTTSNIIDPRAVSQAVRRAVGRLGLRSRRVALVIPDPAAKVSLVHFERVPARTADLDRLVRFQVRKSAPFQIDEAQLSYVPGTPLQDGGQEFIVTLARRDVIEEYERACTDSGLHAGIVDLATFNLVNAALASAPEPSDDWLLVHLTPDYSTMAIVRAGTLILFRNRVATSDDQVADLAHQTAMYYQDRLGGRGFGRVLLAGAADAADESTAGANELRRTLQSRLGADVQPLDPTRAVSFADRIGAAPSFVEQLAPALGIVLRAQAA